MSAIATPVAPVTSPAAANASPPSTTTIVATSTSTPAGTSTSTSTTTSSGTATTSVAAVVDATNSPYRLLVGTNLDFSEKSIDLNGLYAKVDVFLASQNGTTHSKSFFFKNVSLLGNVYLNQSFSGDYSDTLSRRRVDRTLIRPLSNDTISTVAVSALSIKSVTRVKSLGFVLQPCIRLFTNQDPPENPLVHPYSSFFAGLHLEVARRAYITSFTYGDATPLDTLRIPKRPSQPSPYALASSRLTEQTVIFYERYYGISFPYRYISKDVDIRFVPCFGLAYLYPGKYIRYMTGTIDITERNSGITFGAEIRDYASLTQRPILSLYISRSFLLTRLGDLLTSRS